MSLSQAANDPRGSLSFPRMDAPGVDTLFVTHANSFRPGSGGDHAQNGAGRFIIKTITLSKYRDHVARGGTGKSLLPFVGDWVTMNSTCFRYQPVPRPGAAPWTANP